MPDIKVIKEFNAPIEKVWGYIQDHEGYSQFPFVTEARLIRRGDECTNGTGAVRKIRSLGVTVVEKITWYEAPGKLDYRIISANIPIAHRYGMVRLKESDGKTTVRWESGFDADLPILGAVAGILMAESLTFTLNAFLEHIKMRVEAPY